MTNEQFNEFLDENIQKIENMFPINPAISKDDEWRTSDYSDYENLVKEL